MSTSTPSSSTTSTTPSSTPSTTPTPTTPSSSNFTSSPSDASVISLTSAPGIPATVTFGTSTGSATRTTSGSVTVWSATTSNSPADTPTQSDSGRISGTSGLTIGAAVAGSLISVLIVVGCGLYWRKRRRRIRESEKGRIEAPFGAPPQPVINTAPNQSPQSTTLLMKPSSKELTATADGGTSSSPNPLLSPGFNEQQSLMEQLNALKQHIRQVEAQVARNGSVNGPAGGGGTQDHSEPPPEYVAASLDDGTRTRAPGKSRRS